MISNNDNDIFGFSISQSYIHSLKKRSMPVMKTHDI